MEQVENEIKKNKTKANNAFIKHTGQSEYFKYYMPLEFVHLFDC